MRYKKLFISIGLLLLIGSTSAMANEISKDDWINGMSTALPAYLCKAEQYFRQCFNVTQTECEETTLSTTRICLAKNKEKIPNRLRQPEEGTHWGNIIGTCAGSAYAIALQNKRINNSKCNNPNNWK